MANDFFKVDDRQLQKHIQDLKLKRPSQAKAIMRGVLNDQAFSTQKQAKNGTIPAMFHNRTTWIQSSILVTKAQGKDTKKMFSEVGAAKRWKRNPSRDFLGMRDQEFGKTQSKPIINTTWSRGGSFSKNVRPSLRRNKLGSIPELSGSHGRVIAMLRKLQGENTKGAFYIKSPKFKKGVYKFQGRAIKVRRGKKAKPIVMVQDLSRRTAPLRKKPWLANAQKKAVNQRTTLRFFERNWIRYTK